MDSKTEENWDTILEYIGKIEKDCFSENIYRYFEKYRESFTTFPASLKYHHAYEGGLLQHTVEVVEFALGINNMLGYKEEYDDICIASLLHDVGKINQYKKTAFGWSYTKNRRDYLHELWVVNDFKKVT